MMSNSQKIRLGLSGPGSIVNDLGAGSGPIQRWFAGLVERVLKKMSDLIPLGYQDETGFHFGIQLWCEAKDPII